VQIPSRREYIELVISKIFKSVNISIELVNKINLQITNGPEVDSSLFGFGVNLAIDEAIQNALSHGNRRDSNKFINISYLVSPSELKVTIQDEGEGFDVDNYIKTRKDNPEEGRGIILMRNFMDKVYYNKKGNKVTMIKYHTHREAGQKC
jgi:two-component sensor histidine kinase